MKLNIKLRDIDLVVCIMLASFGAGLLHLIINPDSVFAGRATVNTAVVQIAALAISAGLSIAKGIKQGKDARDLEKLNQRPEARVSRGTLQNLALARQAANEGLSAATYSNATNQLNLGLSTSLRNNILYGRGNTNTNNVVRAYNEGVSTLNAADERARVANRTALLQANDALAREEQQIFQNQNQQFQQQANRVADLRSASDENIYGAVGTVLGGVASGDIVLGGTGDPVNATAAPITPSNSVSMSQAAIGQGLATDYNRIIRDQLRSRSTLVNSPANFWRNAGAVRS